MRMRPQQRVHRVDQQRKQWTEWTLWTKPSANTVHTVHGVHCVRSVHLVYSLHHLSLQRDPGSVVNHAKLTQAVGTRHQLDAMRRMQQPLHENKKIIEDVLFVSVR